MSEAGPTATNNALSAVSVFYIIVVAFIFGFIYINSSNMDNENNRFVLYWAIILQSFLGLSIVFFNIINGNDFTNKLLVVFYITWSCLTYLLQIYPGYSSEDICNNVNKNDIKNDIIKDWKIKTLNGEKVDVWKQYVMLKKDVDKINKLIGQDNTIDCNNLDNKEACINYIKAMGKCDDKETFNNEKTEKHCNGIKGIHQKLLDIVNSKENNEKGQEEIILDTEVNKKNMFSKSFMTNLYNIELILGDQNLISLHRISIIMHNLLFIIIILGLFGVYEQVAILFAPDNEFVIKFKKGFDQISGQLQRKKILAEGAN